MELELELELVIVDNLPIGSLVFMQFALDRLCLFVRSFVGKWIIFLAVAVFVNSFHLCIKVNDIKRIRGNAKSVLFIDNVLMGYGAKSIGITTHTSVDRNRSDAVTAAHKSQQTPAISTQSNWIRSTHQNTLERIRVHVFLIIVANNT